MSLKTTDVVVDRPLLLRSPENNYELVPSRQGSPKKENKITYHGDHLTFLVHTFWRKHAVKLYKVADIGVTAAHLRLLGFRYCLSRPTWEWTS